LNGIEWTPQRDTVFRPFDEILCIKVCVECFCKNIEVDVVVFEHVEKRKLSQCCHDFVAYFNDYKSWSERWL